MSIDHVTPAPSIQQFHLVCFSYPILHGGADFTSLAEKRNSVKTDSKMCREKPSLWTCNCSEIHSILERPSKALLSLQLGGNTSLAGKLIPNFSLGCKRMLFCSDFLATFQKNEHCHLVTEPIVEITEDGVRTTEGEDALDILVYATGFDITGSICSFRTVGRLLLLYFYLSGVQ